VDAKRAIFVAPFDELVDPRLLAELAALAERQAWDGFFVWDHIRYREPVQAVADPWVVLAAIAVATERLRIGPMVTPIARRRVQNLARETATLDLLSRGRLTLGVGLGSDRSRELSTFGEELDPRARAKLLDDGLARLAEFWDGEFLPKPVQQPRIPVWAAARWPKRRPLQRAARWDGLFPIEVPSPEDLATLAAELQELREQAGTADRPFDLVAEIEPGAAARPWVEAGATWVFIGFGHVPRADQVRAVIEAGPPRD
jgi:alkanesulfonate monooxygenase SsuD/methylene tetrahydromethanopterin reductase-like flavin-dependent oxidoreductase (luciferase family)